MASSTGNNDTTRTSPIKWLWIAGLLLSSLVAVLLLISDYRPWTNSSSFYHFVIGRRASVAIIVQILSTLLSACNIYVVCCLIDFGTRLSLEKTPLSLNKLQFRKDLCTRQLDWGLPLGLLIQLLIFQTVVAFPGALWAGALTPVTTSILSKTKQTIDVPQYGPESHVVWGDLTWLRPNPSKRSPEGVFSYSPNYDLLGVILTQAASASSLNTTTPTFRKLDNTRYSYTGRSYGVGSSVGLVDGGFASNNTQRYTYSETGYSTHAHCIVNSTSDWKIENPNRYPVKTLPDVYLVNGTLPTGQAEEYAACGFGSTDNITALVGNSDGGKNVFAIAAGSNYAAFDKLQCAVDFVPTLFSVAVNRTERLISVTAAPKEPQANDLEPTGAIVQIAMRMPTSFSQQHGCDLYTSLIGDTFKQNIQAVHPTFVASANSTVGGETYTASNTEYALRGVEDSLNSMLDNTLQAFSSAQLMIAFDTKSVPVSQFVSAVRIGQSAYIYAVAAINFLILLFSMIEIFRTKAWTDMAEFDFTDIRHVALSAALGGSSIVDESKRLSLHSNGSTTGHETLLTAVGKVRVQLKASLANLRLQAIAGGGGTVEAEDSKAEGSV